MKCLNCKKEVSEKAKYCSDKCRMSYTRRTKQGDLPEQTPTRTTERRTTRTDQMFEDSRPGYYNFGSEALNKVCNECDKKFTTTLTMLRQCSPECMEKVLTI